MNNAKKFELICKALKQGYIWVDCRDNSLIMDMVNLKMVMFKSLVDKFEYCIEYDKYLLTSERSAYGSGFDLEDYGKTWFLKEDRSE